MSTQWDFNAAVKYADVVVGSANPVDHLVMIVHDTSNVQPDSTHLFNPNDPWLDTNGGNVMPAGTYTVTVQAVDNSGTVIGTPVVSTVTLPPSNPSVSGVSVRIPSEIIVGNRGN
jgi:hypothetical protein